MSTPMKFQSGGVILDFEAGGDYPARRRHVLGQITDRTAAGTLKTETLGIYILTRVIVFNEMSLTDYQALVDWFLNVAVGSANSFDFTDEYGDTGSVKMLDGEIDFQETSLQLYSGSITLEYV